MKKGLSIVLVVLVVMLFFVPTAFAAGTTISVSEETCEVGEEITVAVSISGNTGFKAYDIALSYNAEELELMDITQGEKSQGLFQKNVGTGKAACANSDVIEGDGVLFSATFKTLKVGVANVSVNVNKLGLNANEQVVPEVLGGSITSVVPDEPGDDPVVPDEPGDDPVVPDEPGDEPVEPEDDPVEPEDDPVEPEDDLDDVPKTGDAENIALYVVVAIAAAAVIAIFAAKKAFSK